MEKNPATSPGNGSCTHPIAQGAAGGETADIRQCAEFIVCSPDFDSVGMNLARLMTESQ